MVHTAHLDDRYVNDRKLLKEVRRYKRGFLFENLVEGNVIPEGYMTSEEFRKCAIAKVDKFCFRHGIL